MFLTFVLFENVRFMHNRLNMGEEILKLFFCFLFVLVEVTQLSY